MTQIVSKLSAPALIEIRDIDRAARSGGIRRGRALILGGQRGLRAQHNHRNDESR